MFLHLCVLAFFGAVLLHSTSLGEQIPLRPLEETTAGSTLAHYSQLNHQDGTLQTLHGHGLVADVIQPVRDIISSNKPLCKDACQVLSDRFPGHVITKQMTDRYQNFVTSYWSLQQSEVRPDCIFVPFTPQDIAVQILTCQRFSCRFSVKSGGHASFAGASSVEDGIVVSLERFDEVTVSEDRKLVVIGTGNRWNNVYDKLHDENITVVGGRDGDVGVGGYVLGGGMSFFSNLYGWACDNIAQYEIVIANGTCLHVNQTHHTDLYRALRGGGDNFGIVTKIWMDAYPLQDGILASGGGSVFGEDRFGILLDAFVDLATTGADLDGRANQILSFIPRAASNGKEWEVGAFASLAYTEGLDEGAVPDVFQSYVRALHPREASIATEFANRSPFINVTLKEMAAAGSKGQPPGWRNSYWTSTFVLTRETMQLVLDAFLDITRSVGPPGSIGGLTMALMLQPITVPVLRNMKRRGGNSLGLGDDKLPRLTATCIMSWADAADDDSVMEVAQRLVDGWTQEGAQHRGFKDKFIYMNYAARQQKVVESYGRENQERLVRVAHEYDPNNVFQQLVTGYHKLDAGGSSHDHAAGNDARGRVRPRMIDWSLG